ncbi:DUF5074 domain-containing protein [Pseudomonas nitroreducens]|uniref:Vgb family protein n=1 Tax=Pseudomonas TaxID=286 RepID=UPI00030EC03A|nr:PQQ-binding-like beta-propeller repeat protein [Pseudomonas nitroreducens]
MTTPYKQTPAQVLQEYGPFPGVESVAGVTFDGQQVWIATGDKLSRLDPQSGQLGASIQVPAHAGTAFDGTHLYQIGENVIQKIDPASGKVLSTIPAPGAGGDSGMAWAEGSLWVGEYRARKIHQIDPETGEVLRTIDSNRFVTGVTWVEGQLWHATWEPEATYSELRRIDPQSGAVLEQLDLPEDVHVSGLEADGDERFYCGGGNSGKVRAVRRPR